MAISFSTVNDWPGVPLDMIRVSDGFCLLGDESRFEFLARKLRNQFA